MNILILQTHLNITCGVTTSILNLAVSFEKYPEYKFFVIVEKNNLGNIEKSHNLRKVLEIKLPRLFFFFYLFFFIKKNKIDIIHSHHRFFDIAAHFVSKLTSIKTVMTVHSKVYGLRQFSYNSQKLISVSKAISDHLINEFKVNKNKILVIPNSIDINSKKITVEREALLKELKIDENKIILGYIGRIDIKEKGIDILLEAYKQINNVNVVLLLVGSGKDENFINSFIKNYSFRVILVPQSKEIYNFYNTIDIFILPSRIEPFGIVLLEAGLMKLPVISSNIDGIPELIENNVTGLLFQSENIDDLSLKIKYLIENNEIAKKLGENLYRKVIENYTSEKNINKIEELYLSIYKS